MDKEMSQDQTMMSSTVIDTTRKQEFNYYKNAVCSEGNKCLQICATKQCKGHAIVCADSDCKCFQRHSSQILCTLIYPKFIGKKLEKNHIRCPQLLNYIDSAFQKLIDQISQFRDQLEKKVKSLGLTENVRQFLQISKKQQFKQLTGQTVSKVLQQLNKFTDKSNQSYAENLRKELQNNWERIEASVKLQIYSLENVIDQFVNQDSPKILLDSKVLLTQKQRKRLAQFFPQSNRAFETKLLYRASENQFSASKFHDKCDGVAHTLTVAKTQFGKVIGGYTPLTWKGNTSYHTYYQKDTSKDSFIFSVTNNDKFTINPESSLQISHQKDCGPVFCRNDMFDLCIYDKANISNDSRANIGGGYFNPKYKPNDKESWELFTGQTNGTKYFKISEWQVYQLNF